MSCADLRPVIDLLGLGLDDAVESPADSAAGKAHLAACAACATRVAQLGSAARALATAPAPTPAGDRAELLARMAAAAAPAPAPRGSGVAWLLALVAAVVVAGAWAWRAERLAPPATRPPDELVGETEPGPPAPISSDAGVIFYAEPSPLETDDPPMLAPTPAPMPDHLPVGK